MLTYTDIELRRDFPIKYDRYTSMVTSWNEERYFLYLFEGPNCVNSLSFEDVGLFDVAIRKYSNSLNLLMFSDFLREVIFAMRRLEALDQPPCPITICALVNRWMTARDDGWEAYNSFMKWYWQLDKTPHTWVKKGSPRLVGV